MAGRNNRHYNVQDDPLRHHLFPELQSVLFANEYLKIRALPPRRWREEDRREGLLW